MSVEHFIDTNVFIYHLDMSDARKHELADTIVRNALFTDQGCISTQSNRKPIAWLNFASSLIKPTEQHPAWLNALVQYDVIEANV